MMDPTSAAVAVPTVSSVVLGGVELLKKAGVQNNGWIIAWAIILGGVSQAIVLFDPSLWTILTGPEVALGLTGIISIAKDLVRTHGAAVGNALSKNAPAPSPAPAA